MEEPSAPVSKTVSQLDLMFIFLVTTLGLVILVPFLMHQVDHGHRVSCPANLKALGTGFYTYANENNGMWPIPPHTSALKRSGRSAMPQARSGRTAT